MKVSLLSMLLLVFLMQPQSCSFSFDLPDGEDDDDSLVNENDNEDADDDFDDDDSDDDGDDTDDEDDADDEDDDGDDTEAHDHFSAILDGEQEVPAVETNGFGDGIFELNGEELSFEIFADDLSGPVTSAHFHAGLEGEDGDVVFDIGDTVVEDEETGEVSLSGVWVMNADEIELLVNGELYVNLHTDLNPGGEIRGQVLVDEDAHDDDDDDSTSGG